MIATLKILCPICLSGHCRKKSVLTKGESFAVVVLWTRACCIRWRLQRRSAGSRA
jgi:hypothetical protein